MTHSFPSSSALQRTDAMSEPAPGSDIARQPRYSPRAIWRIFSSASGSGSSDAETMLARAMMLALLIQARASSSVTRQYSKTPRPSPPYCSDVRIPKKPSSPIFFRISAGISPCTGSSSLATGRISSIANWRASRWIASRSSV
jgi:hypothetical protein